MVLSWSLKCKIIIICSIMVKETATILIFFFLLNVLIPFSQIILLSYLAMSVRNHGGIFSLQNTLGITNILYL